MTVSISKLPARPNAYLVPRVAFIWLGVVLILLGVLVLNVWDYLPGLREPAPAQLPAVCRHTLVRSRWSGYASFEGTVRGPAGFGRLEAVKYGVGAGRTSPRDLVVVVAGAELPLLLTGAPPAGPGDALTFCGLGAQPVDWRPEVGYNRGRQYGPLEATYLKVTWILDLADPTPSLSPGEPYAP